MTCDKCNSDRIVSISAKCNDMFTAEVKHLKFNAEGYANSNLNISTNGDYVDFEMCVECGKIQGDFPISDETLKEGYFPEGEFDLVIIRQGYTVDLIAKCSSLTQVKMEYEKMDHDLIMSTGAIIMAIDTEDSTTYKAPLWEKQ